MPLPGIIKGDITGITQKTKANNKQISKIILNGITCPI